MDQIKIKSLVLAAAVGTLTVGCSAESVVETDDTKKLTILHTNDHHGHFWPNKYGELGMAARKTLIDQIRDEVESDGGVVLLLSGGDINTGVPESDLLDAEPDFKGMTLLGYDAMAIGNHEFDNPLSVLEKQQQWAKFPMLSANIYDKQSQDRKFQPYQMFEKEGLKIAVIGLTTQDTAKIGNPEYIKGLEFRDPKPEAKQLLQDIAKSENPDITIAVTHMGHYQDAQSGGNAPGDVALARYLPEGALDMVIGGHSQEPVCMEGPNLVKQQFQPGDECQPDQQNGTWIMQAFEWGKYVGRADYEYSNGELNLVHYELVPINLTKRVEIDGKRERVLVGEKIEPDSDIEDFLAPYQEQGQAQLNVKIAESNGKLEGDRNKVRFAQTNLGRLIATSHMQRTKADFAVMNSGGVRDSLAEGDITYKDVLTVQPFANIVTYVDMNGAEVLDYLNVVALKPTDSGSYAQFAGITMTVTSEGVKDVLLRGKPLDAKEMYRFSVPSFNAAGGDGYPVVTGHPGYVDTGFVDAEVLKEYLESHSPLDVTQFAPQGEVSYQ
ncbi:bifunctional UDP-sugar hydrolase/5'-nucleotidase UshA [Vibrio rarus]|uniref:bifunctional UDP-sugar hydrolase/5'-nucleotidase UshA n=1 Tax=Vibrio rarus TaxID=413403 RepID=UPI0021C320A9|nr:bifunctional UDP-sugar hydrolase/5'-nucleotidase UshA [Vibrio rarus]